MKRDCKETLQILYQLRQKLKRKGFDIDDYFPISLEGQIKPDGVWLKVCNKDTVLNLNDFTSALNRAQTAEDFVQQLRDQEIPWCSYEEYMNKNRFSSIEVEL